MGSLIRHWSRARRVGALIILLLMVIGMTGCTIIIQPLYHQVTGRITIGQSNLPLAGVEVRMSGPVERTATTDSNGYYTITNLLSGQYTVTVETPFGQDISSLSVYDNTVYDRNVSFPIGFSVDDFYFMSGLWDLYAQSGGGLGKGSGQGTWLWPTGAYVPVYLDANDYASTAMINNAYYYLNDWTKLTDYRVTSTINFGYRPDTTTRFVQVQWVGSGQIPIIEDVGPGTVGLAKVTQFDALGYMQKVLVLVDVDYGDINTSLVMAHEFGHVVGAGHSQDPDSLMYPYLTGSQRNTFSSEEKEYLRVMYYLAPFLKLHYPSGSLASMMTLSSGPSVRTTLITTDGTTQEVNGIPAKLAALPVVQELFGSDASSVGVDGGMLWDSITF